MDRRQLIGRVMQLTGMTDASVAERLLRVSIAEVSAYLPLPERQRWAQHLPEQLRDAALIHAEGAELERFGVEPTQGAIRALASALPAEDAEVLARYLPEDLAFLLTDPMRLEGALSVGNTAPRAARVEGHIASAAGGSAHPVSEARPGQAQPGSAGSWSRSEHTLAAGAEPEPDDTLAAGKVGSKRGLSDADS